MNSRFVAALVLLFVSLGASAQKVKYKDLILLLTSKQYEKAEPFLKRYLKENNDNPNAYLYMGITFHEKALKNDPLTQTEILCSNIDSALLNYDKAYKTIDDRELRKNDEYYEAYMRRDLRTGKFVIKLSDVQLDVENRTKGLKDKKEKVKSLKRYFTEASDSYAKSNGVFKNLTSQYANDKEFYLRADDGTSSSLKRIASSFDSSTQAFDQYKKVSRELGKTGHDQNMDLQEIKDLKKDGDTQADFMKDDLKVWDYRKWVTQTSEQIEKEIIPLRDRLVAYDIEVNKLRARLQKDSVSVKNDLEKIVNKTLFDQLKKYDPDPMPMSLFNMKFAELEFHSDVVLNKVFRDSADVRLRLASLHMEMDDLKALDSIASLLSKRNFEDEEKNYRQFITKTFGTVAVLQSTVNATLDYAKRERAKRDNEWKKANLALNWLVSASDSIPLVMESPRDLKFKPLVIESERYTFGLAYKDSLATGYFYSITPSRLADLKVSFPVDQQSFKKRFFPLIKGVATSDSQGNAFITLTYSTQKKNEKFPVTISKIYRADGLSWSNNFNFDMIPSEVTLNSETGVISVKVTAPDGSGKIIDVDKNGKQIK
ncbi:hypothetical protein WSM22_42620 [Cytophagales bacterium WSM2-2]|nr:hypothetical protein WSM22_42620 [Cytophagales bacterium WSM2-2]